MTEPRPLELATFEDIADELRRRFTEYVLLTIRPSETPGRDEFRINYGKSATFALGLIQRGGNTLQRAMFLCDEVTIEDEDMDDDEHEDDDN